MNRGDHRETIFNDDIDRRGFLNSLAEAFEKTRWSSYPLYLRETAARPAWLRVDRLLGEWGIPMDTAAGRVEVRRAAETQEEFEPPPHGWCAGSEVFRKQLLEQDSPTGRT